MYDRTKDQEERLGVRRAQMQVQDIDDKVYCCYFTTTLKEVAQSWFNGLTPRSVSYFQDLADGFVCPFITSRKEGWTSIHLFKLSRDCRSP